MSAKTKKLSKKLKHLDQLCSEYLSEPDRNEPAAIVSTWHSLAEELKKLKSFAQIKNCKKMFKAWISSNFSSRVDLAYFSDAVHELAIFVEGWEAGKKSEIDRVKKANLEMTAWMKRS